MRLKTALFVLTAFCILFILNGADIDSLYDKKPDLTKSFEGILKETEKTKALNYLNYIRKLHGLKPVTYNHDGDIYTAKASLIMAANNTLTHKPDDNMKCWSKEGSEGAGKSNLALNYYSDESKLPTSESFFDLWLKDTDVDSLGHRRWLLDPFLKSISFGRVDGKPLVPSDYYVSASALLVVNNEQNDISDTKITYVAYPVDDYPSKLFDKSWYLSFSIIADNKNKWNNKNVSFKNASLMIKDETGKKMFVTAKKEDYTGYGLSNVLMWKVAGLKDNVKYMVVLQKVLVNNDEWNLIYHFTLK